MRPFLASQGTPYPGAPMGPLGRGSPAAPESPKRALALEGPPGDAPNCNNNKNALAATYSKGPPPCARRLGRGPSAPLPTTRLLLLCSGASHEGPLKERRSIYLDNPLNKMGVLKGGPLLICLIGP